MSDLLLRGTNAHLAHASPQPRVHQLRTWALVLISTCGAITLIPKSSAGNDDGMSFAATNGAVVSVPDTTFNTNSTTPLWQALNANSLISAPNLTTVNMQSGFTLHAELGGEVSAPALQTVSTSNGSQFQLVCVDTSSLIYLPNLSPTISSVLVRAGGPVNWGSPTAITHSNIILGAGASINFSSANSVDGTTFSLSNGAVLNVAAPAFSPTSAGASWNVNNTNTRLGFPALTTINASSGFLRPNVQGGSYLDMDAVNSITDKLGSGGVLATVASANSILDLSGLTSTGDAGNTFEIKNQGELFLGTANDTGATNLSFAVEFHNTNGPLEIYDNGTLLSSIAANSNFSFGTVSLQNVSAASNLEFIAAGTNADLTVETYSDITAAPEPASTGLLFLSAIGLLRRRRVSWQKLRQRSTTHNLV